MADRAKLDVILHWSESSAGFDATSIYDHPTNSEDRVAMSGPPVRFDLDALQGLLADADKYGDALSRMLYANHDLRSVFEIAVGRDRDTRLDVQIRLLIDSQAPAAYQAIRWETLREPNGGVPLTIQDGLSFSRLLDGPGWADAGPLARKSELRALLVVAGPSDIADHGSMESSFAPVDVAAERRWAETALSGMRKVTVLASGTDRPATLDNIVTELGTGPHVLFLICHGSIGERPTLYLEDRYGDTDEVPAKVLARQLHGLRTKPIMAVLSSCTSAGPGDEYLPSDSGPLVAAGPQLARAGISVIVGMQGNVTMTTARQFTHRLFSELAVDGRADRAMAVARRSVAERRDWWMPVLFSRLKQPTVWFRPGFGRHEDDVFDELWERISEQECTPIVGSGVSAYGVLPERSAVAREWAERRQMPLRGIRRNDLASVAQFVQVEGNDASMPRTQLRQLLRRVLRDQHAADHPNLSWDETSLESVISAIGRHRRGTPGDGQFDLNAILAALPSPVYITTSWTRLLEDALEEADRKPVVWEFNWRDERLRADLADPPYRASVKQPIVYHLFGTIDSTRSLVLSEDDYFGWLRSWTKRVDNDASIPAPVREALSFPSLLFLGYQLDDWEFRFLFQGIKSFGANALMSGRKHIAVQLRPEAAAVDQDVAQDYLDTYFVKDNVNIYWGGSRDFLVDLHRHRPSP